jgi:hypothetical protein
VDASDHTRDGTLHRFGILLPDTAGEGAAIFAARLARGLQASVTDSGEIPTVSAASFAEDPEFVKQVVSVFRADDIRENGPREEPAR